MSVRIFGWSLRQALALFGLAFILILQAACQGTFLNEAEQAAAAQVESNLPGEITESSRRPTPMPADQRTPANTPQGASPSATPTATHQTLAPTAISATQPGGHYPVKTGEVRLAWFYKPPRDRNMDTLFDHFDVFILTKDDEDTRQELEESGVDSPILQYLRFDAIMDPGDCSTTPWQNQVANKAGDFCWIKNEHPDWFLLDTKGRRIDAGDGFVHMDPGNEEWRDFWLRRARKSQEEYGWNGVFLDNVEASLDKYHKQKKIKLENYPDEESYRAAVEGFLEYIYSEYFKPEKRPLAANIIFLHDSDTWFQYLQHLDIVMDESWALDWSDHYLDPQEWEDDVYRAVTTQTMGKQLILVSLGKKNDERRQEFAFASYLLANNGRASFRYASAQDYDEAWIYPNYQYDLGAPAGPMRWTQDGWCREFEKGRVCADPAKHEGKIEVMD